MKFQNCILINFKRMHGRRMDRRMDKPKAIYPLSFSSVGGIKIFQRVLIVLPLLQICFCFVTKKTSCCLCQQLSN